MPAVVASRPSKGSSLKEVQGLCVWEGKALEGSVCESGRLLRDARRSPSSCGCRYGSRCSNGTRRLLGTTSSAWVIQVFDGEVALRGVEAMAGLAVLALANRGWVWIGQGREVAAELLEQECGSVEAVGAGEVVAAVEQ